MKKAVVAIVLLLIIIGAISGRSSINYSNTIQTNGGNSKQITDIVDFDYSIEEGTLILKKYRGKDKAIIISESYLIDGTNYEVTEIAHAIFNGCSANVVYVPKTLIRVYDDTLAYLMAEHIDLYFGGSEEEWNQIFTKYETSSAKEKWNEGNAAGAGEALADKVNAKFGHQYNASKFTYHFGTDIEEIDLD